MRTRDIKKQIARERKILDVQEKIIDTLKPFTIKKKKRILIAAAALSGAWDDLEWPSL